MTSSGLRPVLLVAVLLLGAVTLLTCEVAAQGITQEQAAAILEELRQVRHLLERGQRQDAARVAVPDQRATVSLVDAYTLGRDDAPLTLVEFTDYESPFCRQFHVSTFGQFDTGQVRFVARDLPLDIHKHALRAAHAARCAGDQGKYWEMLHALIVNAARLAPEALPGYASDLALDVARFQECVSSERHGTAIRRDIAEAQIVGIWGTPSFVLGRTAGAAVEGGQDRRRGVLRGLRGEDPRAAGHASASRSAWTALRVPLRRPRRHASSRAHGRWAARHGSGRCGKAPGDGRVRVGRRRSR